MTTQKIMLATLFILPGFVSLRGGASDFDFDSDFSPFVTTGLDPVVHADMQRIKGPTRLNKPPLCMDCRVKPGNDDAKNHARDTFHPAPLRFTSRERKRLRLRLLCVRHHRA
jgi:hypothetical protein